MIINKKREFHHGWLEEKDTRWEVWAVHINVEIEEGDYRFVASVEHRKEEGKGELTRLHCPRFDTSNPFHCMCHTSGMILAESFLAEPEKIVKGWELQQTAQGAA